MDSLSGDDAELESCEAHLYFLAIEKVFLDERGSPLCLSPKDWHVARQWHEAGIPLDWIERTLHEIFEKRRAKGTLDKVVNLRYCKRSVEAAWKRYQKMRSPEVEAATAIEVAPRLAALCEALPPGLIDRPRWCERLRELEGSPEQVESRLQDLDREIFDAVKQSLDSGAREEIGRGVGQALANLGRRLPAEQLAGIEEQLHERAVREHLALPVLSLFAVEAAPESKE